MWKAENVKKSRILPYKIKRENVETLEFRSKNDQLIGHDNFAARKKRNKNV